mmetsp:Transcript_23414/g.65140  ORF Transcript_23414/g.65140 Transcript_23414/m.65140 type:complete len:201 (+) Transcript_23414:202-804(+)
MLPCHPHYPHRPTFIINNINNINVNNINSPPPPPPSFTDPLGCTRASFFGCPSRAVVSWHPFWSPNCHQPPPRPILPHTTTTTTTLPTTVTTITTTNTHWNYWVGVWRCKMPFPHWEGPLSGHRWPIGSKASHNHNIHTHHPGVVVVQADRASWRYPPRWEVSAVSCTVSTNGVGILIITSVCDSPTRPARAPCSPRWMP